MKRIMTAEVNGRRSRGQQKKRWGEKLQQGIHFLRLKAEDTGERKKWRRKIRAADPPLGGINSSLKEMYC